MTAEPKLELSSSNWTEAMPAVEVAVAVIVTVPEIVAPSVGDVMVAETPVALIVKVTGMLCGELEALGSEIVAVAL